MIEPSKYLEFRLVELGSAVGALVSAQTDSLHTRTKTSASTAFTEVLIYAMRVTEKLPFQQYWDNERFHRKRPVFTAGIAQEYGDNIYHRDVHDSWIQEDSHHSLDGGEWNALNAERDLGADAVLISDDFIYWGNKAPLIPPHLRAYEGDDLYPNVRNFRSNYPTSFIAAVVEWFETCPRGRRGRPVSWPV